MADIYYSIKKNRLKRSYLSGAEILEDGSLALNHDTERHIYLPAIDSAESRSGWGRLFFSCDITESMVLYTYVCALDEDMVSTPEGYVSLEKILVDESVPDPEKKRILNAAGARRTVDKDDMLLYDLEGRYLYICIDIIGEGSGTIKNIKIGRQGDNFMDTFPTVYQQRDGFFHRYLSVFSSIYNDFEHEIDRLPDLLDPETCPAVLLEIYGQWLGIDLSGEYLSEEAMRTLVREGYHLNRMKGTKACLSRVLEIALGERPVILEQNTILSYLESGDFAEEELSHASIYDINILIKKRLSETEQHQLLHLIRQFTPLRSRIHLVRLKDSGVLDSNVYMDMNAILEEDAFGFFDEAMEMDEGVILDD